MTNTSHCALHLRACEEHLNNTNTHTTTHSPYGIAGARSSTKFEKELNGLRNLDLLPQSVMKPMSDCSGSKVSS